MRYFVPFVIAVVACSATGDASPHKDHKVTTNVHLRAYSDSIKTASPNTPHNAPSLNTGTNVFALGSAQYQFSKHWVAGVGYQLISANTVSSQAAHGNFALAYLTYANAATIVRIGNQT